MRLYFPLADVLTLAEHAAAAPEHAPSYAQIEQGQPGTPSLVWVKDDGTYLMTSGIPGLLRLPDRPESNIVVYAEGWGPGTGRELSRIDAIAGDDFMEHLDLAQPLGEYPSLLAAIRATAQAGWKWLVITWRRSTPAA